MRATAGMLVLRLFVVVPSCGRLCYPAMVKEKTMKFLAVCGFGMGSSMVLRFTIEKAAAALGIDAEVENTDLASAQAMKADVVFTSYELVNQLRGTVQAPVLPVRNYLDKDEVQAQLATLLGGGS